MQTSDAIFSTHSTQTSVSLIPVLHTQSHSKKNQKTKRNSEHKHFKAMTKDYFPVDSNTTVFSHLNILPDSDKDVTSKLV